MPSALLSLGLHDWATRRRGWASRGLAEEAVTGRQMDCVFDDWGRVLVGYKSTKREESVFRQIASLFIPQSPSGRPSPNPSKTARDSSRALWSP